VVQACVGCKREKDGVVTQLQFVWGVCCAAAVCGGGKLRSCLLGGWEEVCCRLRATTGSRGTIEPF